MRRLITVKQKLLSLLCVSLTLLIASYYIVRTIRKNRKQEAHAQIAASSKELKPFVVVGGSAAGTAAIKTLLAKKCPNPIVWIAAQAEPPYNMTLLPSFITDNKRFRGMRIAGTKMPDGVDYKFSTAITKLDPTRNELILSSGEHITYSKLLLATGIRYELALGHKHLVSKGVFAYGSFADGQAIKKFMRQHAVKDIVIVGAGIRGLKLAQALSNAQYTVNVIEKASTILPRYLDQDGARFVTEHPTSWTLHTAATIKKVQLRGGLINEVTLSSGTKIACQLIIYATAGIINTDFIRHTSILRHNNAIIVDKYLRSSINTIYAAGDNCMINADYTYKCHGWQEAQHQGIIAATNMLGQYKAYHEDCAYHTLTLGTTSIVMAGHTHQTPTAWQRIVYQDKSYYHLFVVHNDRLKGFCLLGFYKSFDVMRLRRAIGKQAPINEALLESCHKSVIASIISSFSMVKNKRGR